MQEEKDSMTSMVTMYVICFGGLFLKGVLGCLTEEIDIKIQTLVCRYMR